MKNLEESISKIREARKLLREALLNIDIPSVERSLREADMYLHWALWQLGEVNELMPELEE